MRTPITTFSLCFSLAILPALASATGCSSSSSDGGGDHGGGHSSVPSGASATASAPPPDAAVPDSAVPSALAPPTLTALAKMAGGLHVNWKNGQKDCEGIEAQRKSSADDFKVIFTVPGAANNKHDGVGLTAGTPYTYRLRCKKGDAYSAYSNEMTGTP